MMQFEETNAFAGSALPTSGGRYGLPLSVFETPHCRYEPMNNEPAEVPIASLSDPNLTAFLAYWESLRGRRVAPSWKEFDLMALDPDAISRSIVVDVFFDPLRIHYRFWGTANVKAKGIDMTSKSIDDFPLTRRTVAKEEYQRVISEKRAIAFADTLVLPDTTRRPARYKAAFEQTMIRLPLSDDGRSVSGVVTLAHWEKSLST